MSGYDGHGGQMGGMSRIYGYVLKRIGGSGEHEVVGLGGIDIDAYLDAFELGDDSGELDEGVGKFAGHGLAFGRCAGKAEDNNVFYHNQLVLLG